MKSLDLENNLLTVTKESLEDYFNEKMRGGIVNA